MIPVKRYLPTIHGYTVEVDTGHEPIVHPHHRLIGQWVLAVRGKKEGAEFWREHAVRVFPNKEEAVLVHDLLMEGKIGWPHAIRGRIEIEGRRVIDPARSNVVQG